MTGGLDTEKQWQKKQRQVSGVGGKGICPVQPGRQNQAISLSWL